MKRGVLLVKNLPHGFFEDQLNGYFSQYGQVTRLRLARSEKTGRAKGYAFVEFKYPEVAQIAGESMNGYLMYRHILKTVFIPPAEQRFDYFKQTVQFEKQPNGTVKLVTPHTVRRDLNIQQHNKPVSNKVHAERVERAQYK